MLRVPFLLVLLVSWAGLFAARPASAQFVRGTVLLVGSDSVLDEVTVELRDVNDRIMASAVSDTGGSFLLQAPRTGEYLIVAQHVGMQTVSATITLELSEEVEVILRMSEEVVVLEPLTVETRSLLNIGSLAGYYERVDRSQRSGFGTIITRDRIRDRNVMYVTDLLRMVPRVTVNTTTGRGSHIMFRGAGNCSPRVYLDGVLANRNDLAFVNELAHPSDLEGVEIYHGASQMPGEFWDGSGCGVILMWTTRASEDGEPLTWRRILAAAAAAALLLFIAR